MTTKTTRLTNGDRAELKGYEAGKAGKSSKSNPHGIGTDVYSRWLSGHIRGKRHAREEQNARIAANSQPVKAKPADETPEIPPATEKVVEATLPFMYASKNAEYVFGAELGDGFVTVTIPKDRFPREPGGILVTVEILK